MNIYHAEILKVKYFQVKRTTEKEARVMNCFCGMFKRQKHCVKSVRIRSYSGPHFPRIFPNSDWIQRDTEYLSVFSPNSGKCGKNVDKNNSEYGHFLRAVLWMEQRSSVICFFLLSKLIDLILHKKELNLC